MKKLFYVLAITIVTSIAITSCTEETVAPSTHESSSGGGNGSDPLK